MVKWTRLLKTKGNQKTMEFAKHIIKEHKWEI